ncbi:MAG: hypothetical protein JSS66_18510 [Armatimonadetes bacterium]|nr:hypothetical protein [Armatimonadota bacterium]
MSGLDADTVRHALQVARSRGFRRVSLQSGDDRFAATFEAGAQEVDEEEEAPAVAESREPVEAETELTSPVVGYFRSAKEPISVGDKVTVGQVVGEVVALGISNDVTSRFEGEVTEVLVESGQAVEFGQAIARVKA